MVKHNFFSSFLMKIAVTIIKDKQRSKFSFEHQYSILGCNFAPILTNFHSKIMLKTLTTNILKFLKKMRVFFK